MVRGKWSTSGCILFLLCETALGQVLSPKPIFPAPLSPRIADYRIDVSLDENRKFLHGAETLVWHNPSRESVSELRFHMYLNAFKNSASTYMTESGRLRQADDIPDGDRGWINVDAIRTAAGENLKPLMEYVHPDDDNENDQTVFRLPLKTPFEPGIPSRSRSTSPRSFLQSSPGRVSTVIFTWSRSGFPRSACTSRRECGTSAGERGTATSSMRTRNSTPTSASMTSGSLFRRNSKSAPSVRLSENRRTMTGQKRSRFMRKTFTTFAGRRPRSSRLLKTGGSTSGSGSSCSPIALQPRHGGTCSPQRLR